MSSDPRAHDDLILAMIIDDEVTATNVLLRASIARLQRMRLLAEDEYVLTVLLAAGMERLLKLTLAFIRVDVEGNDWPSIELRSFGHRIVDLDVKCRELITPRVSALTGGERLEAMMRGLEDDWCLASILELAHDYAAGGRYFNLDYLGTPYGTRISPRQRWQQLIDRIRHAGTNVTGAHSEVVPGLAAVAVPTRAGGEVSRTLAASVDAWRDFYITSWEYGACGPRAENLGQQIAWPYPDATSE